MLCDTCFTTEQDRNKAATIANLIHDLEVNVGDRCLECGGNRLTLVLSRFQSTVPLTTVADQIVKILTADGISTSKSQEELLKLIERRL